MYFIIMALTLERNKFHLQFEKKKVQQNKYDNNEYESNIVLSILNTIFLINAINQSRSVLSSEGNKELMPFSTFSISNSALKINVKLLMNYSVKVKIYEHMHQVYNEITGL